jgi:hypothetical protein
LASASTSLFITEGSQDRNPNRTGTWRQELMQRSCRGAGNWLAPPGLLSLLFFIAPRTTSPGMVPHTIDWVLPHQRPTGLPATRSYRGVSSIPSPSSLMTVLTCVNLT